MFLLTGLSPSIVGGDEPDFDDFLFHEGVCRSIAGGASAGLLPVSVRRATISAA
jgi:hypothetical protein